MKYFLKGLVATALLLTGSMQAQGRSVDAPGQIFYKMPTGKIVTRDAVLQVPSRGQGDVVLKGNGQYFKADRFFNKTVNGRTVFYVVFTEFPGARLGQEAVYRGTYSRGSNLAMYYGDVFVVSGNYASDQDLHRDLTAGDINSDDTAKAKYVAGFYFKAATGRP